MGTTAICVLYTGFALVISGGGILFFVANKPSEEWEGFPRWRSLVIILIGFGLVIASAFIP